MRREWSHMLAHSSTTQQRATGDYLARGMAETYNADEDRALRLHSGQALAPAPGITRKVVACKSEMADSSVTEATGPAAK